MHFSNAKMGQSRLLEETSCRLRLCLVGLRFVVSRVKADSCPIVQGQFCCRVASSVGVLQAHPERSTTPSQTSAQNLETGPDDTWPLHVPLSHGILFERSPKKSGATSSVRPSIPEGPDNKLLRTSAPKAIRIMVFKPSFLNKVPGPLGLVLVEAYKEKLEYIIEQHLSLAGTPRDELLCRNRLSSFPPGHRPWALGNMKTPKRWKMDLG